MLQRFQVAGVRIGDVLGMATQQIRLHPLEATLTGGGRRHHPGKVSPKGRAVNPVEQQIALGRALRWWLTQLESPKTRQALLERHAGMSL